MVDEHGLWPELDPEVAVAVGRALFLWAIDPMMLTQPKGVILDANPAACRALGRSVEEIRGLGRQGLMDPADAARWQEGLRVRGETGSFTGELSMLRADGTTFPADCSSSVFRIGTEDYAVLIFRDVSDRYRLEAELRDALAEMSRLATVDELTGLFNRRGFITVGSELVEQARRDGSELFLLTADVDGLKRVNDEQGHAAGDQMLRDVASVLTETMRGADVVARIGGDEFAVILTGARAPGQAAAAVERLQERLERYERVHRRPYQLSMSVGIAGSNGVVPDLDELVRTADEVLYRAKGRRPPSR